MIIIILLINEIIIYNKIKRKILLSSFKILND